MSKLILCAIACAAVLAQVRIRIPVSGIIFDARTGALRPVNGFPGAATLGMPLAIPFAMRSAVFDGLQENAVVVRADDGGVAVVRSLAATPTVELTAMDRDPDLLAVDARGATVAAYYRRSGKFEILRESSVVAIDWMASAGNVTALAVAGNGRDLLAGTGSGVYLVRASAPPRLLAPAASVSAIAVIASLGIVAYADDVANEAGLITSFDGGGTRVLATAASGIAEPVGLAAALDGGRLWVLNRGSRTLVSFSLASGMPIDTLSCPASVSGLRPLGAGGLIEVFSSDEAPLRLLDQSGAPALFFVPAN